MPFNISNMKSGEQLLMDESSLDLIEGALLQEIAHVPLVDLREGGTCRCSCCLDVAEAAAVVSDFEGRSSVPGESVKSCITSNALFQLDSCCETWRMQCTYSVDHLYECS